MKRAVVVLLTLLLLSTAAMSANQNNWRILIRADDGAGQFLSPGSYVGVYPTSLEGWDPQDGSQYSIYGTDAPGTAMHVAVVIPGQADLSAKSIKAPTKPCPVPKTWDLYVAANVNSTAMMIRMLAYTVNGALPPDFYLPDCLPPTVQYRMVLADNKGKEGAPANGTVWNMPTPTVHSTVAYWNSPINLPVIKLSVSSNQALIAEGYKLRFEQYCVPEPSGLLALGGCLLGLAGFIRRRR